MSIILYHAYQSSIGGVESFNLNFVKRMRKHYNITFVCDGGTPEQLDRIRKYVPVVIYEGQQFECDICIYSSAWGKRPEDHIKADRYIQMVHADFSGLEKHWKFTYVKTPKTTEHYGGGKNIAKTFKEKYGWECGVVPYLLDGDIKTEKVLRLITMSRIGKEKGFQRKAILAKLLKATGRPFLWDIWGGGFDDVYIKQVKSWFEDIPEVSFRGEMHDLWSFVKDADYLVQLSDTEGWCMSIYEALSLGTPCIASSFPNAYEQIQEGKNGYIVPLDKKELQKIDVNKFFDEIPEFKPKVLATEQNWIDILGPSDRRRKVKIIEPEKVTVYVRRNYNDMVLGRRVLVGEELEIVPNRAEELRKLKLVSDERMIKSLKRKR